MIPSFVIIMAIVAIMDKDCRPFIYIKACESEATSPPSSVGKMVYFYILKVFFKKNYLKLIFILMFLNYFDVIILKKIFKN